MKYLMVLGLLAGVQAGGAVPLAAESEARMPARHRELFKRHCFECHDAATEEGSVNLENLSFDIASDLQTAERWQKVLAVINSGEMPPEDADPLSDKDKAAFLNDLSNQMVTARGILSDTGGVITMRRLNRREYANTIEALLGIRPDVTNLPDDQATAGFDTSGASLFFSSDQLEQYLASARRSLALALLPRASRASKTIRIEPEDEYNERYRVAAEEIRDSAQRAKAFLAQSEKPASDYGILDAYSAKKKQRAEWLPLLESYLARPETKTGATLIMTIKQGGYTRIKFPTLHENDEGMYTIRVRVGAYPDAEDRLHYLEFSGGMGTGRQRLGWRKVTGTLERPQIIEFPIEHRPGELQQIQIHQRSHQDRADKNLATIDKRNNGIGTPPGLWVDWAEIVGPSREDPDSEDRSNRPRRRDVGVKGLGGSDAGVVEQLHDFAVRAFRGDEPDEAYLDRLVEHYQAGRDKGLSHLDSIIEPMAIVLSSPRFLYLVESSSGRGSTELTPRELAVRLSYFLWSGPPDEELMDLARSGDLTDTGVLAGQTTRMLKDDRADRFVRGFTHQWLQLDRIDMFQFNGAQFRKFDNAVRASAREEIYQTVHHLINQRLSLGKLLNAEFVVINDLMADYYGIPGIEGHEFRSVTVPAASPRGGLLGTAAIHAMGSDGVRSSPVERGAWVLRHLLHDPPPPAPPNVPQLSRLAGEVLSARELAKAHQEQPQCNQCHQKIDPIGFGLENFDAAGAWRDQETIGTGKFRYGQWQQEKRFDIDPSGTLPRGETFANYFELRSALTNYEDAFARGFTEALIEYGLGRPYGFTDQPLADSMIDRANASNHQIDAFVHALVQSIAFRSK